MKITLVKKILADGSPCQKCADVLNKLEQSGYMNKIDDIVVADERDPTSEGIQIAKRLSVERAPFFVIKNDDQSEQVYTVYLKFVKEVLQKQDESKDDSGVDEAKEILDSNDLDFL